MFNTYLPNKKYLFYFIINLKEFSELIKLDYNLYWIINFLNKQSLLGHKTGNQKLVIFDFKFESSSNLNQCLPIYLTYSENHDFSKKICCGTPFPNKIIIEG